MPDVKIRGGSGETFFGCSALTLIRMAGGIYCMTPETLNRYNSKWPEVKYFLS